jgi:hypothetical protein
MRPAVEKTGTPGPVQWEGYVETRESWKTRKMRNNNREEQSPV